MTLDKKIRLLIVDNDQESLDAAKQYLDNKSYYEVTYCSDMGVAKEAIDDTAHDSSLFFDYMIIDSELSDEVGEFNHGMELSIYAWERGIANTEIFKKKFDKDSQIVVDETENIYWLYNEPDGFTSKNIIKGSKKSKNTWRQFVENAIRTIDYFMQNNPMKKDLKKLVENKRKKGEIVNLWAEYIKPLRSSEAYYLNKLFDD